jgi:hypothetical protein
MRRRRIEDARSGCSRNSIKRQIQRGRFPRGGTDGTRVAQVEGRPKSLRRRRWALPGASLPCAFPELVCDADRPIRPGEQSVRNDETKRLSLARAANLDHELLSPVSYRLTTTSHADYRRSTAGSILDRLVDIVGPLQTESLRTPRHDSSCTWNDL